MTPLLPSPYLVSAGRHPLPLLLAGCSFDWVNVAYSTSHSRDGGFSFQPTTLRQLVVKAALIQQLNLTSSSSSPSSFSHGHPSDAWEEKLTLRNRLICERRNDFLGHFLGTTLQALACPACASACYLPSAFSG